MKEFSAQSAARVAEFRALLDQGDESGAWFFPGPQSAALLRELEELLHAARRGSCPETVAAVMLLYARALICAGDSTVGLRKLAVLDRWVRWVVRAGGAGPEAPQGLAEIQRQISARRWLALRDQHSRALDHVSNLLDLYPPQDRIERALDESAFDALPDAERWGRENGHATTVARSRMLVARIRLRRNAGRQALRGLNILARWLGKLVRDPLAPRDQLPSLLGIRGQVHVWRAMAYRAMLDDRRALGCLQTARVVGVGGTARAWMLVAEAEIGLSLGIMSRQDAAARLTEARGIASAADRKPLAERAETALWRLQTPRRSTAKTAPVTLLASIDAWSRAGALEMRDMPLIEQDLAALPDQYLARAVERINQVGRDVANLSLDVSRNVLVQAMYYSRINAVLREVAYRVGKLDGLAALEQAERARGWGMRTAYNRDAVALPSAPGPADLPGDTLLLEYVWSSKPAVIACDHRGAVQYDLPCTQEAVTDAVQELLELVTHNVTGDNPALRKVLRHVYGMLVEPVAALTERARHIIISPDGELLWRLPFALLSHA